MPLFSISAAARALGRNRATISRHIKEGRLSVAKDSADNTAVEMSEFIRAYGGLVKDDDNKTPREADENERNIAMNDSGSAALIAALRRELEAARERERAVKEESQEREKWYRERIERLERLALPQREGKSLWARIFGR